MDDLFINHEEAEILAQFKSKNSNMARCYLELLEQKKKLETENERFKKQIDDLERLPLEMELIKERNEKLQAKLEAAREEIGELRNKRTHWQNVARINELKLNQAKIENERLKEQIKETEK